MRHVERNPTIKSKLIESFDCRLEPWSHPRPPRQAVHSIQTQWWKRWWARAASKCTNPSRKRKSDLFKVTTW